MAFERLAETSPVIAVQMLTIKTPVNLSGFGSRDSRRFPVNACRAATSGGCTTEKKKTHTQELSITHVCLWVVPVVL